MTTDFTPISQIALGLFIPVSIALFFFMSPQRAALVAILGGDMFLPELVNFKWPLLPELGKHSLPYVCTLIGCLLRGRARTLKPIREKWFVWLTLALIVGAVCTGLTNGDMVVIQKGSPRAAGLNMKDGLYMAATFLSQISLPFFLGCALFRSPKDFRFLITGFVTAALIYVPFALFEIKMSPVWHSWIYGFGQNPFLQSIRYGGYRPLVFMSHGLSLARFLMAATCLAFVLGFMKGTLFGVRARPLGWFLLVVLILCKSTGAIIFAVITIPLLLWSKPKRQARLAVVLASFVFLYPTIRTWDLLPTDKIVSVLQPIVGEERTGSLQFRFDNENVFLERARQRLLFGWGQYGRNFAAFKDGSMAVPDGYWVIQIGELGVVGFIATFGPMLIPLFLTLRRMKRMALQMDRKMVAGMALTLGVVALDWVPNGLWAPYPYLLAGALAGVTRELVLRGDEPEIWESQPEQEFA